MRSSKRKRGDEEEEAPEVVSAPEPVACGLPVVVAEIPLPEVSVPQVPIPQVPVSVPDLGVPDHARITEEPAPEVPTIEPTRPKKRARTAMHTFAQTAAAMAIGAAATWSALAFS